MYRKAEENIMSLDCPRCGANQQLFRLEHKGYENNTICWNVYHCGQCSYTWRDTEDKKLLDRASRARWSIMQTTDPTCYPHNIPPPTNKE